MKLLILLTLAVAVRGDAENPLSRVISLLDDLRAKVTADGEAEAKAFAKYQDWCKDASTNTQFEIKTLTSEKDKLEASIASLTATIDAGSSKIEDLAGSIAATETELKEATGVRNKEHADFAASEKELVAVVDSLDRAIGILEKEMNKNPAAFNQVKAAANAGSLIQALTAVADAAAFTGIDRTTLLGLAQTHQTTDSDDFDAAAPAAATYKSHSSSIFDVLEDLKEKAEGQLSDLRKAEVNAKHNFEMMKQSLKDQLDASNSDLKKNKNAKAAASQSKATAEGDLAETTSSLATAKKTLETANTNCMTVAADHEATVNARNEELKVIAEATDLLKSTTSGASEQSYSFLQFNVAIGMRVRTRADLANSEIVVLIKDIAKKQHSSALAQLASRIQSAVRYGSSNGDDVFGKVKGMIQDMIAKLQKEAGADATEKDYCDKELAKTRQKKEDLSATIDKNTAKIDQAVSHSTQLKSDVKELQGGLAKLAKSQADMDALRREEHADYVKAKADLEQGLQGVRAALVKLREYYGASAFVQQSEIPDAPEAHAKAGGAASGIIGILEVVESDFATDLSKEESQESDAAESYEKMTQSNKIGKTTKNQDVKYKTKEHKSLDTDVAELSSDRDTTSDERDAVLDYLGKLEGRCIQKPETYESRKARREAEVNGLKEALTILEEQSSSFLQRKQRGNLRGVIKA